MEINIGEWKIIKKMVEVFFIKIMNKKLFRIGIMGP
jgi:hypothetical protein